MTGSPEDPADGGDVENVGRTTPRPTFAAATVRGLGRGVAGGARRGGRMARSGMGSVAERLIEVAPRIPVRDLGTLRRQFPGLGPEDIADRLIAAAVKGTMTVGAGIGAAAMLPNPPAMPAELATETLGVAAVEYKLIAELHEVYGMRAPGTKIDRTMAYVDAWAHRRGVGLAPGGLVIAIGSPLRRRLERRLISRAGRSALSLAPLLTGAAAGALLNRRETRKLGQEIRDDLRRRSPAAAHWAR